MAKRLLPYYSGRGLRWPISTQCFSSSIAGDKDKLQRFRRLMLDGPNLNNFFPKDKSVKIWPQVHDTASYLPAESHLGNGKKVKFITYGCQMNVNDVELVRSLLLSRGYAETMEIDNADVALLMTCSIRESAEKKVWNILKHIYNNYGKTKVVGILGCMAQRIRTELLRDKVVDIVAGPDSYRDLPRLLAIAFECGEKAINVQLSLEETYADVAPIRINQQAKSAYVSIMRGCDNMCTYCIVPFTRGRERSRPISSVIDEVRKLSDQGVKEVVLLGQNVNSYNDCSEISAASVAPVQSTENAPGFKTVYKPKRCGRNFVTLLEKVSDVDPEIRIRFTSPHPKDFPIEVINLIKERSNICNEVRLPAQSGSNWVLETMGRGYTKEAYLELVYRIRSIIPDVSLKSDFIAGFCGETETDHKETLELIQLVQYSFCYVFPYSMREKTRAKYRLKDDVLAETKQRRHLELTSVFRSVSLSFNQSLVGTYQLVLIESQSKRLSSNIVGRTDGGTKVVINRSNTDEGDQSNVGDYVVVQITDANSQTLCGKSVKHTTLQDYEREPRSNG